MAYVPGAIDPASGLWADPGALSSPGPGGVGSGIISGLAIMNAIKSAQLANEAEAQRRQAYMQQVSKNAIDSGGTFYDNPEGQEVLSGMGLSPETGRSMYESSPQGRIQRSIRDWQAANPGKVPDASVLQSIYLTEGVEPPTGFWGYARGQEANAARIYGIDVRDTAGVRKLIGQRIDTLTKAGMPFDQAWAQIEGESGVLTAGLPANLVQAIREEARAAHAASSKGAAPVPAATVAEKTARASLEEARAAFYNTIASPTAAKLAADAGFARAHSESVKAAAELKRMNLKGVITPTQKIAALGRIAIVEGDAEKWRFVAANQTDPTLQANANAVADAKEQFGEEMRKALKEAEDRQRQVEAATPAPGAGKKPYDETKVTRRGTDKKTGRAVVMMSSGEVLDAETGQKVE